MSKALAGVALAAGLLSTQAMAQISFSTDFEGPTAISEDNWQVFVNYFEPDCTTYVSSPYGFPAGDNGPQATALTPGASSQVMNAYSNYDDPAQQTNCLEVNIYQQVTIQAGDVGNYVYSYDVELPPDPANVGENVNAYIRVFSADFSSTLDLVVASSVPGSQTINFEITEAMIGGNLQFGVNNYSFNYAPTGMYYDNISFELEAVEPPPVGPPPAITNPQSVNTLSDLGLLLMIVLLGFIGGTAILRR
jgi:hypothetical protein